MIRRGILRWLGVGGVAMACCWGTACRAQEKTPILSPLTRAAGATELPLGAWGPYAKAHVGPCYLANRLLSQLFSFPLVIGQRREEIILRTVKTTGGKTFMRPQRVILERRAMGFSPVQAMKDDKIGAKIDVAHLANRRARILDADADGYLWSARVPFAPSALAQTTVTLPGAEKPPASSTDWGAGEATVEWFPAFTEPAADGLLARVTLVNRSATPQTYFIDQLGGIDAPAPQFATADLTIASGASAEGVLIHHAKCEAYFALSANTNRYTLRAYRVSDAYFAPEGAMTQRDTAGAVLPAGLLPSVASTEKKSDNKGAKGAKGGKEEKGAKSPEPVPPVEGAKDTGAWGLLRVDDIEVAPGQEVTLVLCIGVGGEADAARDSAQTLLSVTEDANAFGKDLQGAYVKAQEAHRKARFTTGEAALDRLMAQSLVNVPFLLAGRMGVASRQETPERAAGAYQPAAAGFIALAWSLYRPLWAASQLNTWFFTNGNPDAPLMHPLAVPPTPLFALWELYAREHDREMLARFYPFANRRYRELLAAGRSKENVWLFAWPESARHSVVIKSEDVARTYAPEYSAYVIRAAKLLRLMAERLDRPAEEIQGYVRDAAEATRQLNASLWDAKRGLFVSKPVGTALPDAATPAANEPDSLRGLLPLLAGPGALSPEQRAALLQSLTDPARFWSEAGVRSVSKATSAYHAAADRGGAVHIGPNWMLWKALLDLGETETARKLADNVLAAYRKAQMESDACPEWLNGDTGAAGGATDFSGDTCALLPLYAAYHRKGTVSTGWETDILDSRYDPTADAMHLVFRCPEQGARPALLCVLGKPNGIYMLSGAMTGTATADANGVLTLTPPENRSTRQLEIVPAPVGSAK